MSDEPGTAGSEAEAEQFRGAVQDIGVELRAVLGRNVMPVSQLLKLGRGAVVELDNALGQPVTLYVGNLLVARGEVVILSEERLGVSITTVMSSSRGIAKP